MPCRSPTTKEKHEFPPPSRRRQFVKGAPAGRRFRPRCEEAPLSHADDARGRRPHRAQALPPGQDRRRRVHRPRPGGDLGRPSRWRSSERTSSSRRTATWACTSRAACRCTGSSPSTWAGADGPARGKDGNMHMGDLRLGLVVVRRPCSPTRSRWSPARHGLQASARSRACAITFSGEGATSRGDWHEGINLAAVQKAPASTSSTTTSTPTRRRPATQFACEALADARRSAYGIPGYRVDGNDPDVVFRTAREVVERARSGGGPSLVECDTARMTGHSAHDDPSHYVPKEFFEEWEKRDPIEHYTQRLLDEKVITPALDRGAGARDQEGRGPGRHPGRGLPLSRARGVPDRRLLRSHPPGG